MVWKPGSLSHFPIQSVIATKTTVANDAEALLEDITPGPWALLHCGEKDNSWAIGTWQYEDESWVPESTVVNDSDTERWLDAGEPEGSEGAIIVDQICENHYAMANLCDGQFIANAPRLVRGLLSELIRVRRTLNEAVDSHVQITAAMRAGGVRTPEKAIDTMIRIRRELGNGDYD